MYIIWIQDHPTRRRKAGRVAETNIVPITSDEFKRILNASDEHRNKNNRLRLRALVLLMYYSGLAIRDAVTLKRDHIKYGKLFLRRTKTGTDVLRPLPGEALVALKQIGSENEYFFWSGKAKPKSAVGNYQRALKTVFEEANTFITNLLTAGVPIETVAALVGHSSTKMTMKYSHWIKARQKSLEAEVKKSWAQLGTVDTQSAENR
jgi:integrase/recombinase XerD